MTASHQLFIRKESLKFSSAHMTVFPDGSKEPLHGHNYRVDFRLDVSNVSLARMLPFALFKEGLRELCRSWDERVLLAEACPFFRLREKNEESIDFTLCGKRYVLPADEVVLLPVDNISAESLAQEAGRRLLRWFRPELGNRPELLKVEMRIEESDGQGASWSWDFAGGTWPE